MTDDPELVDLATLVAEGRLRAQAPDFEVLEAVVVAAESDIQAADAIGEASPSWAEAMLYEACLRCSRVVVQAAGYRITATRGHVTAITAADTLTAGADHQVFVRLNRMRRTRNDFMYETGASPSLNDLTIGRRDAERLIEIARSAIQSHRPRETEEGS